MPGMFACLTKASDGLKTRFSFSTDSMLDDIHSSWTPNTITKSATCKDNMPMKNPNEARALRPLPALIFASRWLQLPLYLGLIVAQAIYVWLFWQELFYLVMAAVGNVDALSHILDSVAVEGAVRPKKPNETVIMLVVLGLIDVVMISNLLIMVIVGG